MPRLEIEIDDKGELIGEVPGELAGILKRIEAEHHKVGYGKGVEQAAKDARKQIDETIALEKARFEALQPLERERVASIERDNQTLTSTLNERAKEFDRTLKSREEAHANEVVKSAERAKLLQGRIRDMTKTQIRAEALQAGARDESLDELAIILDQYVGYDDDMQPFVKQADGTAQLQHGKPLPIGAFVKQYLDAHPHHRRAPAGRGGDGRRGASLSGAGTTTSVEAARARIEGGDRSASAINDLFNAGRHKAS